MNNNDDENTSYVLPQYRIIFDDLLADKYKPIVYSHECLSGNPEALYYRIITDHRNDVSHICIQYYFYWAHQWCMMASHRYDYEPIFIFLTKDDGNSSNGNNDTYVLERIVNSGLGGVDCGFHKSEIRPKIGERSTSVEHFSVNITKEPLYPFGKDGSVKYDGCAKVYPLTDNDLTFEDDTHSLFGIRACSNVFSGAVSALHGERFNPPMRNLTDSVLKDWYFHHYNDDNDMPFGHDVTDPFTYPYIKYHSSRNDLPRPWDD